MSDAFLGFEINSSDAVRASFDLGLLGRSAEQAEERVEKMAAGASTAFGSMGTSTSLAFSRMRSSLAEFGRENRYRLQNASFQIQDFAVQVAAGTSAMQAAAQQAPQFLSAFGTAGVLFGTAAAILIPVAGILWSISSASRNTADEFEVLSKALDDINSATERAKMTTLELVELYGRAGDEVRDFVRIMATAAQDKAWQSARQGIQSMFKEYRDQTALILGVGQGIDPNFNIGIERLVEEFGLAIPAAREFQHSIEKAASSGTYRGMVEALDTALAKLEGLRNEAGLLPDSVIETHSSLVGILEQLRLAEGATTKLEEAQAGVTGSVDRSTAAAERFTDEVQRSVEQALKMEASTQRMREAMINLQHSDPVSRSGAIAGLQFDFETPDLSGLDPILKGVLEERLAGVRAEVVRNAEATSMYEAQLKAKEQAMSGFVKAIDDSLDAYDKQQQRVSDIISALQAEAASLGETETQRRVSQEIQRAGIDVYSQEGREVARLATEITILKGEMDAASGRAVALASNIANVVNQVMSMRISALPQIESEINLRYKDDPVGRASALAGARFDASAPDVSGLDPILQNAMRDKLQSQRKEAIEAAAAIERNTIAVREWEKAQQSASRAGSSGASEVDREAERRAEMYNDTVRSLELEISLIGKSEAARRTAQTIDRLELQLGSAQAQQIENLINLSDERTKHHEEELDMLERIRQATDWAADTSADAISRIVEDFSSLNDVMADTLRMLGKMAIQNAFKTAYASSGIGEAISGGILGSIFGIGQKPPGRASGGRVQEGRPYTINEVGEETFIPDQSGYIQHANADNISKKERATLNITFAPNIDNRGASTEAVQAQARILSQLIAEFEGKVVRTVRKYQAARVL